MSRIQNLKVRVAEIYGHLVLIESKLITADSDMSEIANVLRGVYEAQKELQNLSKRI